MTALYIILLLGGLIFFHELGHFIFARLMGVHVVTFSIGFGPPVLRLPLKRSEPRLTPEGLEPTEYVLAAIPLGGYVRMFGDDPEEDIPDVQRAVSFNHKAVWQRFLIMAAGPGFNLLLPFIIFFGLYLMADRITPSVVGTIDQAGPAGAAGLDPGDRITSIQGEPVDYWWQLQEHISKHPNTALEITWDRRGTPMEGVVHTEGVPDPDYRRIGIQRDMGRIGVQTGYARPLVSVLQGSVAERAGLSFWDEITSVDDVAINSYHDLLRVMGAQPDKPVTVNLRRFSPLQGASLDPLKPPEPSLMAIELRPDPNDPMRGMVSVDCVVRTVHKGSPAEALGLRAGDVVQAIDARQCPDFVWLEIALREDGRERSIHWVRNGKPMSKTATHWIAEYPLPHALQKDRKVRRFGALTWSPHTYLDQVENKDGLKHALMRADLDTRHYTNLTFYSVVGLFNGRVDHKELSGPVGIAHLAAHAGEKGWSYFFGLMAYLSISLGLINLIPIPILDGGHILFLGIEAIRRRPVSLRTRQMATYLGFAFIVLLMIVVIRNDIAKVW